MEKVTLSKAIETLKKEKERKFDQTVDLIVNLKGVDIRKTNISLVTEIPHVFREKKVCGFLTKKNDIVKTITKPEFSKYKDVAMTRALVKDYDFFIAHASLMPSVATTFGKVLGPSGKMPSPQLGILTDESEESINKVLKKISGSTKIRVKEPSIKVPIAKISMKENEIEDNIKKLYDSIVNALPTKQENVKNVMIKLTMSKPLGVNI
jgi:large subunit ribosomal protein L1